jgi:hypothetical protein
MTWFMTYELLLSSMRAGSVRVMSPGRATTRVPPDFGWPDGLGASEAGAEAPGVGEAAGVGDAAPAQAATIRATAAKTET